MPGKKPKQGKKKGGVEIEEIEDNRKKRINKFNERLMRQVNNANASIAESKARMATSYTEMEEWNPIIKDMMKRNSIAKVKRDQERQSKTTNNTQAYTENLRKEIESRRKEQIAQIRERQRIEEENEKKLGNVIKSPEENRLQAWQKQKIQQQQSQGSLEDSEDSWELDRKEQRKMIKEYLKLFSENNELKAEQKRLRTVNTKLMNENTKLMNEIDELKGIKQSSNKRQRTGGKKAKSKAKATK